MIACSAQPDLFEATLQAIRDPLRPILMTSLVFCMGVLPLALATGASSGAQRAIGAGVLGSMIVSALLGLVFTLIFFVLIKRMFRVRKPV